MKRFGWVCHITSAYKLPYPSIEALGFHKVVVSSRKNDYEKELDRRLCQMFKVITGEVS